MGWLLFLIIVGFIYFAANKKKGQTTEVIKFPNTPYKPHLNAPIIDITNIHLSAEQKKIFEILENTNRHIFVTGKAGTGKSVLLQYFRQNSKKRLVVVAPTGVAALNVNGQTIHSLFRIPPDFIAKNSLRVNYKVATLLRNLDTVVIDEVSMVRTDLMDAVDFIFRQARNNNIPFGGVQIIMFGDLYQLPPVVGDPELHKYFVENNGGFYFFNADVWENTSLDIYELMYIFRQEDNSFKEILNSLRKGKVNEELLKTINLRSKVEIPGKEVITLVTTNQLVNEINDFHLSQLNEKMFEYKAIVYGNIEQSSFPTEEILRLKKGAQIILLKNDKEKRWVNGSLGYIHSLSNNEIKVNINGFVYNILQETWSKIRYYYNQEKHKIEEEVVSSFTQYPIRLAWAMTIHKAQGQTLGSVIIDMGEGAFAHGQTYVALSRCKSLEGLYLKREIVREDIIVDPDVINFMNNVKILESSEYDMVKKTEDKPNK